MRRRNSSTRGGSMDLAKFLEARIAEDEAVAKAAFGPGIALNWPALPAAVDVFVDRYGPLRAVREVGAKRKILAEHALSHNQRGDSLCFTCTEGPWPCRTIALLAAIYGDHPDFDPAWKE